MMPAGVRRWVLLTLALGALTIAALIQRTYAPIDPRADIVSVRVQPVPEGPPSHDYRRTPDSSYSLPISLIEAAIPIPLPGPGVQSPFYHMGGDLIIELAGGRTITYGPCWHPAAIQVLWARMEAVERAG